MKARLLKLMLAPILSMVLGGLVFASTSAESVTTLTASAATNAYYVRAGAGGDNSGSDWTNAFAELPAVLQRDAIYYVADGAYPSYTFDDAEDGSRYITVTKAIPANHGTSVGWDNSYGDGQAVFSGVDFTQSYFVWDGQVGTGWDYGSYGFYVAEDGVPSAPQRLMGLPPVGYSSRDMSNITIMHTALRTYGAGEDVTQACIYSAPNTARDIAISHNYMANGNALMLTRKWMDSVIEYNFFDGNWSSPNNHGQLISTGGGDVNVTYRYNVFRNPSVFVMSAHGNVHQPDTPARNSYKVYGNVVIGGQVSGVFCNGDSGHLDVVVDSEFHNNTIINVGGSMAEGIVFVGTRLSSPSEDKSYAYNNLVYNSHNPTLDAAIQPPGAIDHDYNAFFDCTGDVPQEAHGQIASGDPFRDIAGEDYRLSQATDPGLPLPAPFQVDVDGRPRGADGLWDRGAYEFVSELDLRGAPGDRRIYLDWTVNTTLPSTATWHIDYYTTTASAPFTATDPFSTTRAYTLTDHVINYEWYTVTLHAMVGGTSWLSDTVRVMPTDIFVYLPLLVKED